VTSDYSSSMTVSPAAIHATAIIGADARLGERVEVGPYAIIAGGAVLGEGTVIGSHAVIGPDVVLGRDNRVGVGVVLGGTPQHRDYGGERTKVIIGDRNVFGEYTTVNRAYGEGESTIIGNDNFIMSYVHVAHNCRIGDNVVLVTGVGLGGHVFIDDLANVGGQATVHQFARIGRLAMVGGTSALRQDVPPFVLAAGWPARAFALNTVGLVRAVVPPVHRAALKRAFVILYRSGLSVSRALARLEAEWGTDPFVAELIAFIRSGSHKRGIVRWNRDRSSA